MATAQPAGQARNTFGRDHGNFASVATMPNGSGNALPSASVPYTLEAGDRCYLAQSATTGLEYICVSAGTSGGGNAVWVPNTGRGPWSSVLYVDNVRGSDTTGTRGNANLPFATIQAANNAMQTDDVIQCGPQVFVLTAALTVPATVVRGACVGWFRRANRTSTATLPMTQLRSAATSLWDFGANLGMTGFVLQGMTLCANGAAPAIAADGSSYAHDAFFNLLNIGLLVEDVVFFSLTAGITGKYVQNCNLVNCQANGEAYSFTSGRSVNIFGLGGSGGSWTFAYDATDPLAATFGQCTTTTQQSILGNGGNTAQSVTVSGQAQVAIDEHSSITAIKGNALAVVGAKAPRISCAGYVSNGTAGVDFRSAGSELPDTATALTVDFRGTRFYSANNTGTFGPATIQFKVAGVAPANFQTVKMESCAALTGVTVIADNKIHLTARGATFPSSVVYQTPGTDGDITPPQLGGVVNLAVGGTVAHTWAGDLGYAGLVRTGAAADYGLLTSKAQGADAVISVLATTGFTTIATAVGGNTAASWENGWK